MPRAPRADAAVVMEGPRNIRVWFPIRRGLCAHGVAREGTSTGVSVAVREGRRWALVRELLGHEPRSGLALLRTAGLSGPDRLRRDRRAAGATVPARELRRSEREMQVVFQDPYGAHVARMSIAQTLG